jgi:hypothetical protein
METLITETEQFKKILEHDFIKHQRLYLKEFADYIYIEQLNFAFQIPFDDLDIYRVSYTPDHIAQAQSVIFNSYSPRYTLSYRESYTKYEERVIDALNADLSTRQAVMKFVARGKTEPEPCLSSLQFIVRNDKLDVVANWRSLELREFLPYDLCLIYHITAVIQGSINEFIPLGTLYANVGSAHQFLNDTRNLLLDNG